MLDATWGAAAGAIAVSVIGAIVAAYLNVAKTRHQHSRETHVSTLDEYRDLLARLEEAYQDRGKEIGVLRTQRDGAIGKLSLCYQSYARAEERIAAYEDLLTAANIPFRRWVPRDGGDSSSDMSVLP